MYATAILSAPIVRPNPRRTRGKHRARRPFTTAALAAAVVLGFIGLGAVLSPASAAKDLGTTLTPDGYFLADLVGSGADLTDGQVTALLLAADRVCDGVTAGVPVMVMADTLVGELGLSDTEARHLVNLAAGTRC